MKHKKPINFVLMELVLFLTIIIPVTGIVVIYGDLEIENQSVFDLLFQDHFPCKWALFLDLLFIVLILAVMIFLLARFLKTKDDHYFATVRRCIYISVIVGFLLLVFSAVSGAVAAAEAKRPVHELDITVTADPALPHAVDIYVGEKKDFIGRLEPGGSLHFTRSVKEPDSFRIEAVLEDESQEGLTYMGASNNPVNASITTTFHVRFVNNEDRSHLEIKEVKK